VGVELADETGNRLTVSRLIGKVGTTWWIGRSAQYFQMTRVGRKEAVRFGLSAR
jgi:hypothetical protein